ncbi:MAG: hypothetical protein R3256_12325 [Thalassovita sp.]|nr:hypothetical protein [Thalassovita sp.]
MNRRNLRVGSVLVLCGCLTAFAARSGELDCDREGLMDFSIWLKQVELWNPGIVTMQLFEPERSRMLDAMPCEQNARSCPVDGVFALRCAGNPMVLIAYEKGGCAVFADEMTIESFKSIVSSAIVCQSNGAPRDLILPEGY